MKSQIIVFILLIFYVKALSQSEKQNQLSSIEVSINRIDIIPHDDTLIPLINSYARDFELTLKYQTNGNKPWNSFLKYPTIGVSSRFIDFNNPQKLGYTIGVLPFISFNLVSKYRIYSNVRIGVGVAYVSKRYNYSQNPTNIAISSSINLIGDLRLGLGYCLTDKMKIFGTLNATHLSNGSVKKPNYGLNMTGFGIGLNYSLNASKAVLQKSHTLDYPKSYMLISFAGGVKEVGDAGGPKYYPLTSQISYVKPLNQFIEIAGAIDIMYDKSTRFHLYKMDMDYSSPEDDFSAGATSKLHLNLDRIGFYGELGLYLYKPNPRYPIVYHRLGIKYKISEYLSAYLALKTHFNIADHIDWGLAIKI